MTFNDVLLFSKEFSLIWFFLFFIGIVIWAYWPGNKDRYEEAGKMIMDDGELDEGK
ncbi:MAG: cbb3-type cytochrome c oxidase subunit 3 [Magnetococcales bacterium]|nr:cbb3-type cytochrome c oxidase subunit 3 [Magnetococcales bacterium]